MSVRGFLVENVECFQETRWLMSETHLRIRSFLLRMYIYMYHYFSS